MLDICFRKGQYGTSSKANNEGYGLPILRMGNIFDGQIVWEDLKFIKLPKIEAQKYKLAKGDLIFNRTNSAELVGKTAVFDSSREALFASYLIRFFLNKDIADPEFISSYINSSEGRLFIKQNMSRAIGQANISASTMHKMPVPLPGLTVQQYLVKELFKKRGYSRHLKLELEAQLKTIKKLPAALLRRAFRGEL